MNEKTPFRPTLRSQTDLEKAWRHLMAPLGFGGHSLWIMLIDPGDEPVPQLIEVTEAEDAPDPDELDGFIALLRHLAQDVIPDGGRIAFLRSRPGSGGVNDNDRGWAATLYDACRVADLPCEVVHLANDEVLVPIPMDELQLAKPA